MRIKCNLPQRIVALWKNLSQLLPFWFTHKQSFAIIICPYHEIASFTEEHFKAPDDLSWRSSEDKPLFFVNFVAVINPSKLKEKNKINFVKFLEDELVAFIMYWLQVTYDLHHKSLVLLVVPFVITMFLIIRQIWDREEPSEVIKEIIKQEIFV